MKVMAKPVAYCSVRHDTFGHVALQITIADLQVTLDPIRRFQVSRTTIRLFGCRAELSIATTDLAVIIYVTPSMLW